MKDEGSSAQAMTIELNTPRAIATFMGAALISGLLASTGCDAAAGLQCRVPADGAPIPLVDHGAWRLAEVDEDPFASARPAELDCPADARAVERFGGAPSYAIETADCAYTTVVQPLLADACEGDRLHLVLWHYLLTAPEAAEAHLAVQIGDTPVWQRVISIPSESELITEDLPLDRAFPAGTPVYFHVRNHGNNSYNLIALSLLR